MSLESKSAHEANSQEPFKIRAHHLGHFDSLIKNKHEVWWESIPEPSSPRQAAENIRKHIKKDSIPIVNYKEDVMGQTLKNEEEFVARAEAVFERFKELPDNYPVTITETPDELCGTCATGNHCKTSPPKDIPKDFNIIEKIQQLLYMSIIAPRGQDQLYLNNFLKLAKKMNLPKPRIEKEKVIYSDTKKKSVVKKVITTAGSIRQYLAEY